MQAVLAPFAVAYLGCTGDEARLDDCAVDLQETFRFFNATAKPCDPFGDSYAFVACGNASAPAGALPGPPTPELLYPVL